MGTVLVPLLLAFTTVSAVLGKSTLRGITALFIVDGEGRPTGVLHLHHLLRAGVV